MNIAGTAAITATDQIAVHQPDDLAATFIYTYADARDARGGTPILIRGDAIDRAAFLHRLADAATAAAAELLAGVKA